MIAPLRADAFSTPYRDPEFDGPTDPILVRDDSAREWKLLYTQRRASLDLPGVEWVHGTRIGVAASRDGGATWEYRGVVDGLDPDDAPGLSTHWAPDVVRVDGRWLMFLTWIEGVRSDWTGRAGVVQHVSDDLESWERLGEIDLRSDRVIDASLARDGDGRWRLWYKDERRDSTTWQAVSDDPFDPESWRVEGEAIGGRPHEGPKVFRLAGSYWMIVDEWRGQAVYRSDAAIGSVADGGWVRQRADDGLIVADAERLDGSPVCGRHADVVPLEPDADGRERALLVYFTHPGWDGSELADMTASPEQRRSHVRSAVLTVDDEGVLVAS